MIGDAQVLHCSNCFCDSLDPLPGIHELTRAYQDFDAGRIARDSFAEFASQSREILAADLRMGGFQFALTKSLRFLDYGCGGGHFVKAAEDLGFSAHGIDLDAAASDFGRLHRLDIAAGTIADIPARFGPKPFNVVLLMHVLEHVPYPGELLRQLVEILQPGGFLIVGVPDQDSFPARCKILLHSVGVKRSEFGFVQPPIHLHGFRARTFAKIAATLGLSVVSCRKTSPLDRKAFPSSAPYWKGLVLQRFVYALGAVFASGGHLKVLLRRSA